jgi:phage terminase small subunit
MVMKSRGRVTQTLRDEPLTAPIHAAQRRAKFIAAYLLHPNATRAAISAGYSPRSAYTQGSRLLNNAEVAAALKRARLEAVRPVLNRYEVTVERVIAELARVAFSNMADYGVITEDGQFQLDFSEMTVDQAAAIQSVKTKRRIVRAGDKQFVEVQTELKLASKLDALVELGRYLGIFEREGGGLPPITFQIVRTPMGDPHMLPLSQPPVRS